MRPRRSHRRGFWALASPRRCVGLRTAHPQLCSLDKIPRMEAAKRSHEEPVDLSPLETRRERLLQTSNSLMAIHTRFGLMQRDHSTSPNVALSAALQSLMELSVHPARTRRAQSECSSARQNTLLIYPESRHWLQAPELCETDECKSLPRCASWWAALLDLDSGPRGSRAATRRSPARG